MLSEVKIQPFGYMGDSTFGDGVKLCLHKRGLDFKQNIQLSFSADKKNTVLSQSTPNGVLEQLPWNRSNVKNAENRFLDINGLIQQRNSDVGKYLGRLKSCVMIEMTKGK